MQIIFSTLYFLVNLSFNLYIFVLLLRLLFQKLGAPWHNSISQFVIRFTEPMIKPLRRFIPGFRGFDLSILFIAFVLLTLEAWLLGVLHYQVLFGFWGSLIIALGNLGLNFSNIYFYAIIISALMSWFPLLQNNPLGEVSRLISNPLLAIFRRFIPPISGMDFSPIFALIGLLLVNWLVFNPIITLGTYLALAH
jgi:YggT family protein